MPEAELHPTRTVVDYLKTAKFSDDNVTILVPHWKQPCKQYFSEIGCRRARKRKLPDFAGFQVSDPFPKQETILSVHDNLCRYKLLIYFR